MALTILTLSCFLFYLTSKYFPSDQKIRSMTVKHKTKIMVIAVLMLFISLVTFYKDFTGVTAWVMWLTALMTILSALILTVKFHIKWLYGWLGLCIIFLIFDFL